jgi:hypothetical protein
VGWAWDDSKQDGLARCRKTSRRGERAARNWKEKIGDNLSYKSETVVWEE